MLGLFVLQTGIGSGVRLRNTLTSKRGSSGIRRLIGCSFEVKCIKGVFDASIEFGCSLGAKSKECFSSGKRKRVCGNDKDVLEDEVVLVSAAGKIKEMLNMNFMEHIALLQKHVEDIQNDFKQKDAKC